MATTADKDTIERLTLEGDMVRVTQEKVIREVRLQDLLPHIENRPPITLGLLPKTAVFAHWDESNPKKKIAQFLAERTAGMHTCSYNNRRFNLSIPWTYFLFTFETSGDPMEGRNWMRANTQLFWAKQQVTKVTDELVTALVPNVDTHGQICWGSTGVDGTLPLGINVDRTVEEFYRTEFTHSNGAGSPWQSVTGKDDWAEWQKQSTLDPAAFLKMPEWDSKSGAKLRMRYTTVKEVLGSLSDRSAPIEVTGRIAEMPEVMTYGRAEAWLKKLTKTELRQIVTGIKNIGLDDPLAIAPEEAMDAGGQAVA